MYRKRGWCSVFRPSLLGMKQFFLISTIYPIGGLNRRANCLLNSENDYCEMKANNGETSPLLLEEVMTNI